MKSIEYSQGKIDTCEQIIRYLNKEIELIKNSPLEKNTPRQITNGGKLHAYRKAIGKAKVIQNIGKKYLDKC